MARYRAKVLVWHDGTRYREGGVYDLPGDLDGFPVKHFERVEDDDAADHPPASPKAKAPTPRAATRKTATAKAPGPASGA